ncbi:STAS domain-containing protein [Pseudonocardia pini]|uniref:STAS domain-containing protein n=1 Tax=Pseudonocardia pini TaxID=2758030 RepID=UPI001FE9F280|nr:STAS domain-containing protein [Pseudonocardia pini]
MAAPFHDVSHSPLRLLVAPDPSGSGSPASPEPSETGGPSPRTHSAGPSSSGGPGSDARCSTTEVRSPGGSTTVVVWISGDLDLCSVPRVARHLLAVLDHSPAEVIVDLSALRFCALHGMGMLIAAAGDAAAAKTRLVLSSVPAQMARVMPALWPVSTVPISFSDTITAIDDGFAVGRARAGRAPAVHPLRPVDRPSSSRTGGVRHRVDTYRSVLDRLVALDGSHDDGDRALVGCLQDALGRRP